MKTNIGEDGKRGQLRQGDVLLTPFDGEVSDSKILVGDHGTTIQSRIATGSYILARGEGTGHDHVLVANAPGEIRVYGLWGNSRVVVVPETGATLVHTSGDAPDHDAILVAPGMYWSTPQVEDLEGTRSYVRD